MFNSVNNVANQRIEHVILFKWYSSVVNTLYAQKQLLLVIFGGAKIKMYLLTNVQFFREICRRTA